MTAIVARTVRYGIVGLAVSIAYSLAVVLVAWRLPTHNATAASGIAFAVMLPLAYLGHRYVAFSDAARDRYQPLRFAVSTTSSFLVAVGGMYAVTEIFDRSYLFGIALNWALIPATNYLVYLFWVFRVAGRDPAAARGDGTRNGSDRAPLDPWGVTGTKGSRMLSRPERS